MSNRFPDFDVRRQGGKIKFESPECTPGALAHVAEALANPRRVAKDSTGQALWLTVRGIILGMVDRGELVRVGLTWDIR